MQIAHTHSAPFANRLRKIVSVGRVKRIADSPFTGKITARGICSIDRPRLRSSTCEQSRDLPHHSHLRRSPLADARGPGGTSPVRPALSR